MGTESRDYNDNSILNATQRTRTPNGCVSFSIMLPSGRPLESAPVREEDSAKAAVEWCGVVRANIQGDLEEKKAAKRRELSGLTNTTPEAVAKPAQNPDTATDTESPAQLIRRTVVTLDERIEANTIALGRAREALAKDGNDRAMWIAVGEGIGINFEEREDAGSKSEEPPKGRRRTRRSRSKKGAPAAPDPK